MRNSMGRILEIVRAEVLFRFRRTSAVITMLIVATGVYFIVPDVSTGRTLMRINGSRALNTSTAVALGTGMFCTLFLSMVGYYIVSNSFRRDILSRTGIIIAASPVSSTEYIMGKFLGNSCYLAAITATCMISSMVMFVLRGETSLEPWTFLSIYAWLTIPTIAFCSAIAISFEALPLLSGRFGDVLFFFVWAGLLGSSAAVMDGNGRPGVLSIFDVVGITPIIGFMQDHFHTTSMSIGFSEFDASRVPVVLNETPVTGTLVAQRFSTLVVPLLFLTLGRVWFHRFNPTKIKFSVRHARKSFFGKVNNVLKPLSRILVLLEGRRSSRRGTSLFNALRADVVTTFLLSPFAVAAVLVFAILSLTIERGAVQSGVLPAIALASIIATSDIVTRDHAAGMLSLLSTAPHLRRQYVLWKFASALAVIFLFTLLPMLRLAFALPVSALSLLTGSVFMAGAATGLGVLTRSQKPFMAIFLMLLYITLNAKDAPFFDFIGMYGKATAAVLITHTTIAALLLFTAQLKWRSLTRE